MEAKICLIAEGVIRDAETNNISIFNIYERLTPAGFPFLIQKLVAFAFWEREQDEPPIWEGEIILDLNGEELFNQPFTVNFGEGLGNRLSQCRDLLFPNQDCSASGLKLRMYRLHNIRCE